MLNKSFNISLSVWIKACLNHLVVKAIGKENMLDFSYMKMYKFFPVDLMSVISAISPYRRVQVRWTSATVTVCCMLWLFRPRLPQVRSTMNPHSLPSALLNIPHNTICTIPTTFRSVFTRVCSQCASWVPHSTSTTNNSLPYVGISVLIYRSPFYFLNKLHNENKWQ